MKRLPPRPVASTGFTLIEVMITVAIVAILAAVAYPSYRDYIIRGRLVEGTNGLAAMRAEMERHFQDNRTYMSVAATATAPAFPNPCAAATTAGEFTITCNPVATATTYTLRAQGSGATNGFRFTVNQNDARATTQAPTGWSTSNACWLVRKGQTC